jgi:hypothetical protein
MGQNYGSVFPKKEFMVLNADAASAQVYPNSGTSWYSPMNNSLTGSLNNISVADYTPSVAGKTAKAFVFPNGGLNFPTMPDSSIWDFRNTISFDCVACKENSSGRQSIWAQINTSNPWNGMGLVNYSLDSNGNVGWWGGNYTGSANSWWNSGLAADINEWVWVGGTWSGTTRKLFMREIGDTSFQTATTTSYGSFTGSTASNTFVLGDNGTGGGVASNILDGAIALVRIWTVALTDDEMYECFENVRSRFGL